MGEPLRAIPAPAARPAPPVAPVVPHTETLHGDVREDGYRWLREKTDLAVIAYLEAENAYTAESLRHTEPLQERLYQELLGRIKETDLSVPSRDRGWWYYTRTEAGRDYPLYCRRQGQQDAPEQVYLDQNALAAGKPYHALGGMEVSPDGRLLLYLEDLTGFREYTLYVKDLDSGAILDRIPGVWNGTAWADDNRTFFYTTADAAKRADAVWRHVVGAPPAADVRVFREDDVRNTVTLSRSRSGRYVFIASESFTASEWRCIPTADPMAGPRVIAARRAAVEYTVTHAEGCFLILTNDAARNFRVVRAPEDATGPAQWTDWLPHRDAVFLESVEPFRHFVVVVERLAGLRRLRVTDLRSDRSYHVSFPEVAYEVVGGANPEFDTRVFRFSYSSPVTPRSVYDYDMATRRRTLRKRQEIPSGFAPEAYLVRRLMAPARDGARVPVSLLLRRDTPLDGSAPLLLHGYGAYGAATEPSFRSPVLSLVDRGFIFAIAHVRGGQELGRAWYEDGKLLRKMNSFFDFIDVAEEMVRRRYTRPDRLVASGASAGGLLVAVVANLRPDLFRAIVAEVPFVDVINTMSDPTLPLTAQEWEEWGDPGLAEHYACLKRYSPYENVRTQAYPWMLVTAALNDSQVMYWEPAKWVARLRALNPVGNPLYLRTTMAGGHFGASGRYQQLREAAFRYAFLLEAVGRSGQP